MRPGQGPIGKVTFAVSQKIAIGTEAEAAEDQGGEQHIPPQRYRGIKTTVRFVTASPLWRGLRSLGAGTYKVG